MLTLRYWTISSWN